MIKEDTPLKTGILLSSFSQSRQALMSVRIDEIYLFKKQLFFIYNNYILLAL